MSIKVSKGKCVIETSVIGYVLKEWTAGDVFKEQFIHYLDATLAKVQQRIERYLFNMVGTKGACRQDLLKVGYYKRVRVTSVMTVEEIEG